MERPSAFFWFDADVTDVILFADVGCFFGGIRPSHLHCLTGAKEAEALRSGPKTSASMVLVFY